MTKFYLTITICLILSCSKATNFESGQYVKGTNTENGEIVGAFEKYNLNDAVNLKRVKDYNNLAMMITNNEAIAIDTAKDIQIVESDEVESKCLVDIDGNKFYVWFKNNNLKVKK